MTQIRNNNKLAQSSNEPIKNDDDSHQIIKLDHGKSETPNTSLGFKLAGVEDGDSQQLPDINSRNNFARTAGSKIVSNERKKELQLPQASKPPKMPKSLRETASHSAHN